MVASLREAAGLDPSATTRWFAFGRRESSLAGGDAVGTNGAGRYHALYLVGTAGGALRIGFIAAQFQIFKITIAIMATVFVDRHKGCPVCYF
jgi:hypothetical protein